MLLLDDVWGFSEEKRIGYLKKHEKVFNLLIEVDDLLVKKFFNTDSFDMLDDKIEVLEALKSGTPPAEISKYYDVLENYPKNEMWD